jgi:hypothetical protein
MQTRSPTDCPSSTHTSALKQSSQGVKDEQVVCLFNLDAKSQFLSLYVQI